MKDKKNTLKAIIIGIIVGSLLFILLSCAPQITSTRYNPHNYTDSAEYCWYIHTPDGWVHHCEYHYHEPGFKIYPEGGVYQENDSIVGADTLKYWTR